MPGIEFAVRVAALERTHPRCRKAGAVLIALAASLSMGGCADKVAQYEAPLFMDSGAPSAADQAGTDQSSSSPGHAYASEDTAASDWSQRTYVYRGGRDPKTGLARTQL
jgi:hypothetical protein